MKMKTGFILGMIAALFLCGCGNNSIPAANRTPDTTKQAETLWKELEANQHTAEEWKLILSEYTADVEQTDGHIWDGMQKKTTYRAENNSATPEWEFVVTENNSDVVLNSESFTMRIIGKSEDMATHYADLLWDAGYDYLLNNGRIQFDLSPSEYLTADVSYNESEFGGHAQAILKREKYESKIDEDVMIDEKLLERLTKDALTVGTDFAAWDMELSDITSGRNTTKSTNETNWGVKGKGIGYEFPYWYIDAYNDENAYIMGSFRIISDNPKEAAASIADYLKGIGMPMENADIETVINLTENENLDLPSALIGAYYGELGTENTPSTLNEEFDTSTVAIYTDAKGVTVIALSNRF